jgi:TrmH family RNA methyltransferase
MSLHITSLQNPRVKRLLNLQQKSALRKAEAVFVVEGLREVERAIKSGYVPQELWIEDKSEQPHFSAKYQTAIITCNTSVFSKISYRESAAEVVAVFEIKEQLLEKLKLPENPLLVVVEDVEKPGNLGAILRTCNGLGADAVLVCNPQTDIYNPNVIRNSLGAFFDIPVIVCSNDEAIEFLEKKKIQVFSAYLEASIPYHQADFTQPAALVFGSEANGLTDVWVKNTSQNIIVPMHGVVDSLNVSVAVAILLAEAIRQRL